MFTSPRSTYSAISAGKRFWGEVQNAGNQHFLAIFLHNFSPFLTIFPTLLKGEIIILRTFVIGKCFQFGPV